MENGKIKIAQVIGMAVEGGVEACIKNYYTHIDRSKVQFDFFVENTSKIIDKEEIERLGGKIVIIPSYKNVFAYIKALKKLFKQENYDIVHSNMNALSVFTLYAAKKAGIKIRIAHSHSTSNKKEWKKTIIKNILRPFSKKYATHYVACSELAGRWLFGNKTYDAGEVVLINNAIDLDKFAFNKTAREEIREQYALGDKFVVGNIGRLVTVKNQTFLLDIFNEYAKENANSALLILGGGPLEQELKEKTKTLGIEDKVIFAGVHSNPEKYYSAMDCFLLPSLYEGLPVVGVEAQVAGLPVYTSDTVTKETRLVDDCEFLPLSSTAKEWAERILSKPLAQERNKGLEQIKGTQFDIKHEANRLIEYYTEICKGADNI